ncbi:MAG: aspartate kinase [Deltaproteobacteria bacterium]|nr:MAG: aspartate kinase [Deltaproteobacteria bacterium]
MARIIQKYGGSSVADLERLAGVADRVCQARREGHEVVVVVSAMGNTTTELLSLAKELSAAPDRRELDMLVSVGERISMALLAIALRERGIPARSLTGSQAGLVTDESHGDARVVAVRPARLLDVLGRGEVPIIAGFQGVSREREVTTLGRGGSDTTAVLLAAALDAAWCELCSDVDGIWSADPRVVSAAKRLEALSLDEALSLARGGARVLFEDAVQYARDQGVELRAVATFGPGAGTRLTVQAHEPLGAKAVTGDAQLVKVRLGALDRDGAIEALRAAGARLRRRRGERLYVDVRHMHGASVSAVHRGLTVEGPCAVVTAVGSGLGQRLSDLERGTASLLEAGLWIVDQGAEGDVAWWELDRGQLDQGVEVVHRVLVLGQPTPLEAQG